MVATNTIPIISSLLSAEAIFVDKINTVAHLILSKLCCQCPSPMFASGANYFNGEKEIFHGFPNYALPDKKNRTINILSLKLNPSRRCTTVKGQFATTHRLMQEHE